jgi:CDP-2,3-bis-(O-geranylgeranyl)-sn-glycerol synthase
MGELLLLLLKCVYLMMPAYFANMAPPLTKKLGLWNALNVPIDGGRNFSDGKPLFGRNKTYRGFVVGVIGGIIGAYLQMALLEIPFFNSITLHIQLYNTHIGVIIIGALLGFGAIAGDLIESFFKRRLSVGSGERFVPWDQTDLVIGAYLFSLPILYPFVSWYMFLISMVATFFLHILVNHAAFYLHIRKERW